MEHTTLYRKYRPDRFADVRSQDHVVNVLAAAIEKKNVPHAILFTGTRGTGKTTLARIFARELGVADEDLYELDAASNNSVEDIRTLNEAVVSLPFSSQYKIYILDEVHMLSKSAWNAFLKTLEEPPKHVIFMMATTELDKVPDTVISRCQVFTLSEPSKAAIAALVQEVVAKEQVTLPPEAVQSIAIAARGSYRDALSITQKVLMLAQDGVVADTAITQLIGAPSHAIVADILDGLAEANAAQALTTLARATAASVSMDILLTLLIERVRAVMLYRATKDAAYLADFGEDAQRVEAHVGSARVNSRMLIRLLEAHTMLNISPIPSLALECACIDICAFT